MFQNATGTKLYVVSRSGSDTIQVRDGANPSTLIKHQNLGQAEAATLTPDGRRLLIAAGSLFIWDTTTDNLITTLTTVGSTPVDIAVARDGSRAFVLSATSNRLTAVDLSNNTVTGNPITIPGSPTGVATGYNGLIYVTTTNRIYEVDGRSMSVRREIELNARPGKLAFTPDGRYAIAANQTPITGSAALLIDLVTGNVPSTITAFGVTFDQLIPVSNETVYALSYTNQSLYEISISPFNIAPASFGTVGTISNVRAFVATNESPKPRFLFAATPGSIYRLENSSLPPNGAGQQATPADAGSIVYVPPVVSGVAPVQVIGYNDLQTTSISGTYLPLITRVLDSTGRPLQGINVTFSTTNSSAQIQGTTFTTDNEGYVQTTVIAPDSAGTFTVVATAGTGPTAPTYEYTLTTGTSTGGGGGGTATTQLKIFSGQGQMVREQFLLQKPLVVQLTDLQGAPIANQPITFALDSGTGTMSISTADGTRLDNVTCQGLSCTATTDAEGKANVSFFATVVNSGTSFVPQTVTATNGSVTVKFNITTVISTLPGGQTAAAPLVDRIYPEQTVNLITGKAGTTLEGAIKVRIVATGGPQQGQGIPNVGLNVTTDTTSATGPTAYCDGDGRVALSDATGLAVCNLVIGGKIGRVPLNVNIGGSLNLGGVGISLEVQPGPASNLRIIQGNNQSGNPGAQLNQAFVAEISDAGGNLIAGQPVNWTIPVANSITLKNVVSVSDGSGRVSALGTLGNVAGTNQVRVTSGSLTANFNFTTNIQIAGLAKVSGDNQTAVSGGAFAQPLIVRVTDDKGAAVPNQAISFNVASGSASLSASSAVTNANGQAQVSVTAGSSAGAVTIRASLNSLSQTFSLTVRLPGPVFTATNVVNAASNQPGVTPCGLATIYGSGLAPGVTGVVPGNLLGVGGLPLKLQNLEITVGGTPAPIYAIANQGGQESVIFQAPCSVTPATTTSVAVTVSGGSTTVSGITVYRAQPGLFEVVPGDGTSRYAAVQRPNGSWVTPANPAVRGEILKILVTGLGSVTPATTTNAAGVGGQLVQAPLVVGYDNAGVRVVGAEYAPGLIGIYIVSFELPATAPVGQYRNLAIAAEQLDGTLVFGNSSTLASVQ